MPETISLDLHRIARLIPGYDPFATAGECWFDADAAQTACDFFPECLTHVKGELAGKPFLLEGWQKAIVANLFGWKRKDDTRRYREALVFVPRKSGKSLLVAGIVNYVLFCDGEPGAELYCLDPSARVLTADMTWKPVGAVIPGECLVTFDEEPSAKQLFRKLRTGIVTSTDRIVQPCWRITFADGRTVVASSWHLWRGKRGTRKGWIATKHLYPGRCSVHSLGQPWERDVSYGAGYLAGVFDGEASFGGGRQPRSGFRIHFAQLPGVVLETTRQFLHERGYHISANRRHKSGVDVFEIAGLYDCLRFLGEIRPKRLLAKAAQWYEGKAPNHVDGYVDVIKMEYLGDQEVVAIGTSTKTLFVEGFFSHNSAAAERDQARLVFEMVKHQIEAEPELASRAEIFKYSIVVGSNSYKAISADSRTKHGFNTHLAVIDELHAQPDRELVDVLTTSTGARRQPLIIAVTTSDFERESICNEKHEYACKVRDGIIDDTAFLPVIYEASIDDDWTSPEVWRKTNPNLNVSVSEEFLAAECKKAKEEPAFENTFKRLYLNIKTEQAVRWLQMERYDASDDVIDDATLIGKACWCGLDLSTTTDLSAFSMVFPDCDGSYDVLCRFWVPESNARKRAKRDRVPYTQWIKDGWITATPGDVIDYDVIRRDINELKKQYDIREIPSDRWNATQLIGQLEGDGFTVFAFGQGYKDMTAPTKELEKLIIGGKIRFGRNPVLRWMASNVFAEQDAAGNLKPSKKKSSERIDGVVATIMGLGRAMAMPVATASIYDRPEKELVFL